LLCSLRASAGLGPRQPVSSEQTNKQAGRQAGERASEFSRHAGITYENHKGILQFSVNDDDDGDGYYGNDSNNDNLMAILDFPRQASINRSQGRS